MLRRSASLSHGRKESLVRAMHSKAFPKLLSPLKLPNGATLANRAIMGSMHTGLEEQPDGFERMAAFYAERAAGGVQ